MKTDNVVDALPDDMQDIKSRVLQIIYPIKEADQHTMPKPNFMLNGSRTEGGRSLPSYELVYFLLAELLNFRNLGQFEKVAWSFPIDHKGRFFMIEYRKFGLGIFAFDKNDEPDALEIAKKIKTAVRAAAPFFEWIAKKAVASSRLNVINRCAELFERYEFY